MQVDIKGLLSGINNSVFVKEQIEKISEYRLSICNNCEHYSPNIKNKGLNILFPYKYCDDCKCNMFLKTRWLSAKCPLGGSRSKFPLETSKWQAYTTIVTGKQIGRAHV